MHKSLEQDSQTVADALATILFDETIPGLVLTGEALKEFQAALAKTSQLIALQKKTLSACMPKIDRTTLKDAIVYRLHACTDERRCE